MIQILILLITLSSKAQAHSEDDIKAGLLVGSFQHQQEMGQRYGSGLGWGGFFEYAYDAEYGFWIHFTKSSHNGLTHIEIPMGFHYYFENIDDFYLRGSAGIAYLYNELGDTPEQLSTSGFGFFIGAGGEWNWESPIFIAPQVLYIYGFEQTVQLRSGQKRKALQDNINLLLMAGYRF